MGLVSLPNALTDGTTARGSEVRANDDAIVAEVNGNLTDANISVGAGVQGSKLSNVAGSRVPTDRIEDDAIDSAKLKDDPAVDANRAVTTNHVRDGAITAPKLGVQAVLSNRIKFATYSWTPGVVISPGSTNSTITTVTSAAATPLMLELQFAGVPAANLPNIVPSLWLNTATGFYHITIGNPGTLSINLAGLTFKATFVSVA